MRPLTLVKLGGSLITDKTRPGTARPERLRRLARTIAAARVEGAGPFLLGHGSGSYGHVEARRHGLHRPLVESEQWMGLARTQDRAGALHRLVVEALLEAGVAAFSWAPASALVAAEGRPVAGHVEPLAMALGAGLLPVVFGDVVLDRGRGAAICSTEEVFRFLASALPDTGWRVTRVLWMGETDGVWDARGATLPVLDAASVPVVGAAVGGARGIDVTGGMVHRLETAIDLAALGIESWILDGREPDRLQRALAGRPEGGTRVPSCAAAPAPGA